MNSIKNINHASQHNVMLLPLNYPITVDITYQVGAGASVDVVEAAAAYKLLPQATMQPSLS